jgi:glutaminyl-peptide cyclotransferase
LSGINNAENIGENVLNGIAYDQKSERLFVTGKRWSKIFEIKLVPTE